MMPKTNARVLHAEMWGTREGKYKQLAEADVSTTAWAELAPDAPFHLFLPRNAALLPEYQAGWTIPDVFSPNGDPAPGIVTTHDEFAISWNPEEAAEKVERLLATETEPEARGMFRLCSQNQWQYRRAKAELRTGEWRSEIVPLLYRPFDTRWTVWNRNVAVHRRERVMRHILAGANIGLSTARSIEIGRGWEHVLCTKEIIQHHTVSLKEVNYLFPLYLYPFANKVDLFDTDEPTSATGGRRPNLAPKFITDFAQRLGMEWVADGTGDRVGTFGPEDVFHYMYAVFHSPMYRERYAEFLKIDFPRLPLTTNPELFRRLCALGAELTGLHLMERHRPLNTRFPAAGDNTVEKARYTAPGEGADEGRVWINPKQYFDGVPPEVWEFHIGVYQVAEKWLKDRKGRQLSFDDLLHYQRVLATLARTGELMVEVDEVIEEHGGWPLAGSASQ
jgi:hypothetical protein